MTKATGSDLKYLREQIIIALFSDDDLLDQLVLKGGNALSLIHAIGDRASIDLDFSIENDELPEKRVISALTGHFKTIGYEAFDVKVIKKPHQPDKAPDWWGGYVIEFKLLELDKFESLFEQAKIHNKDPYEEVRRQAIQINGPSGKATYKIDISKNEDCSKKEMTTLDDITIYVYSLEMIAIEKLRAICQQMPNYEYGHRRARSRDFYDIYTILENTEVSLTNSLDDFKSVFEIKKVPLEWLWDIPDQKEFHEADWPGVKATTKDAKEYDFYFQYICNVLDELKSSWNM